jgi:hypothetical protein
MAAILQLFPLLISAGESIYSLIASARTALAQSTELTPDQEKQRDAHFAELESKPWWTPDA